MLDSWSRASSACLLASYKVTTALVNRHQAFYVCMYAHILHVLACIAASTRPCAQRFVCLVSHLRTAHQHEETDGPSELALARYHLVPPIIAKIANTPYRSDVLQSSHS